jgi:hypothetical protein
MSSRSDDLSDTDLRSRLRWPDDQTLDVDGATFEVKALGAPVDRGLLRLMKPRPMIERYVDLLEQVRPQTIVELGIYQGGSTGFLAQLLRPERLVALDIAPTRVERLDQFLASHDLGDAVRLHYATDQSDAAALERILDEDLGGEPPDMVIDDASHWLDLTRASFEVLFPRLRPGGVYVIEDWGWGLFPFSPAPQSPSLSVFVYELLLTMPFAPGMIAEVTVNEHWAAVRKGVDGRPVPPWRVADSCSAYAKRIIAGATEGARPVDL